MKLQGIFPPIATPFDSNGDLYKAKVRHNVEKWNLTNLAGYVVCSSPGEGVMLATEEIVELWGWVAEFAAPGRLLLAGTGRESVRETVSLTNKAADLGYQAAVVCTPHCYRNLLNNQEAQALYFRAVADQSKIPIVICNSPQVTGIDIPAETVVQLSLHPNIVAIQESSGDLGKAMQVLREGKPGFQVLAGSASTLWPSLIMGAAGAVLPFACAAPYSTITIWEAHRTRETEVARDWQSRIAQASELVTTKYGIPGLKYAMDLNGYYGGPCRLPLAPLSPGAKCEIQEAFRDLKG